MSSTCEELLGDYTRLDPDAQARNILAWRPVVYDIYQAYTSYESVEFIFNLKTFYVCAADILAMDSLDSTIRKVLEAFFRRAGEEVLLRSNGINIKFKGEISD